MERSAPECSQSGLPSPHPSNFGDTISEVSLADHASAAPNFIKKEVPHSASVATLGTPISDHSVYPPSSRTTTSPQQIQRAYQPASSASSGGMAQQPNNPSIAAQNPTYSYGQHPAYAPPNSHIGHYPHPTHPHGGGMYGQQRPDWTYAGHHAHMNHSHSVYAQPPAPVPPQRPSQVYSFVSLPGAQQHKRPRRRYEEVERMYKCGWHGCEKAYGTLNHLNAHVTMQRHGDKRTPEAFKEIRKEWKQKKKEEEARRKAEEEHNRMAAAAAETQGVEAQAPDVTASSAYLSNRTVQLPPIGQSNQYPAPPSANVGGPPMVEYSASHMYSYPPHSPYGQPNPAVYAQSNGGQPPSH